MTTPSVKDKEGGSKHNENDAMLEQIEKTYEALKVILQDDATFEHVAMEVFKSIDIKGDESLEKKEVVVFIQSIC